LAHPDDEVVVLSLRGEQILQALERALELYPQKNNAFLQLAGAEVRFNPKAEPGKRILSVVIAGAKLEPERVYKVATTAPMARGALGYFRVWSRDQITQSTGRTSRRCRARLPASGSARCSASLRGGCPTHSLM
jgi:2',3'-cyclic-nucleotide 2'-phosphodiesterase (5'-nucleotidase family)